MRLSTDQIKAGILHPDREVREMSLGHFRRCLSSDPTVMSTLIQALERYGWDEVCFPFYGATALAQTAETAQWLIDRLSTPAPEEAELSLWNCWMRFFSRQLTAAPLEVLADKEPILTDMAAIDSENLDDIVDRVRISYLGTAELWIDIEAYCDQSRVDMIPISLVAADISRYATALARLGPETADRVLELLSAPASGEDEEVQYWLQAIATEAAGRMRLTGAIPQLFELLQDSAEDELEWHAEQCAEALIRIGSDDIVRLVGDAYRKAVYPVRVAMSRIFEGLRSELATRTGLELLAGEQDDEVRSELCAALLDQFDSEVLRPARELILADKADALESYLIRRYVAASTLLDAPLGDFEPWRERAAELLEDYLDELEADLTDDGRLPSEWEKEIDALEREFPFGLEDEDEDGELDEYDADEEFSDEDDDLEDEFDDEIQRPIVHSGPKVGRNDPCPCGSGKKFKKCCMHKTQGPPPIDW